LGSEKQRAIFFTNYPASLRRRGLSFHDTNTSAQALGFSGQGHVLINLNVSLSHLLSLIAAYDHI
jgi:hypothetical protein